MDEQAIFPVAILMYGGRPSFSFKISREVFFCSKSSCCLSYNEMRHAIESGRQPSPPKQQPTVSPTTRALKYNAHLSNHMHFKYLLSLVEDRSSHVLDRTANFLLNCGSAASVAEQTTWQWISSLAYSMDKPL